MAESYASCPPFAPARERPPMVLAPHSKSTRGTMDALMISSRPSGIVDSTIPGAARMVVACSAPTDPSPSEDTGEQSQAAHARCGNGRCERGETCSSCSQDCGACPDAGGNDAGSGTNPC